MTAKTKLVSCILCKNPGEKKKKKKHDLYLYYIIQKFGTKKC